MQRQGRLARKGVGGGNLEQDQCKCYREEREREGERENEFGSPGLRNVAVERAI
jgi:hypothetical protein